MNLFEVLHSIASHQTFYMNWPLWFSNVGRLEFLEKIFSHSKPLLTFNIKLFENPRWSVHFVFDIRRSSHINIRFSSSDRCIYIYRLFCKINERYWILRIYLKYLKILYFTLYLINICVKYLYQLFSIVSVAFRIFLKLWKSRTFSFLFINFYLFLLSNIYIYSKYNRFIMWKIGSALYEFYIRKCKKLKLNKWYTFYSLLY